MTLRFLLFPLAAALTLSAPACADPIRDRIYLPEPMPKAAPAWAGRAPREVVATTADGLTLKGYWWPPETADAEVVVFFHGNAGNRATAAKMAEPLIEGGRGLLIADYRGYGGNPGKPTQEGLFADGEAFMALARSLAPQARTYVFGYSLGGAVALEMASRHEVAGVITLGAFATLAEVAPAFARPFLPDRFDNRAAILRVDEPVLLIHGTADEVIPFPQARELKTVAAGRKVRLLRLDGADHHPDFRQLAPMVWKNIAEMPR
ncbi:alpha/beta hydrolase [Caulobacter mirabilis]|uniref:Alpha/beta hydrolase n=1 Tax=Caulobacter mirabilis TaxID=69666 RepID=A0A2D2AX52_9CAUL|nr:alpha/beta hydrolase [Caulobacter mirabilis]ATQ42589.1 alpha/beta hydrolase [Caulobacter mirabilis]